MQKIVIVGASSLGRCAVHLIRPDSADIVGFLDDDDSSSTEIEGLPHLGSIDRFKSLVAQYGDCLRPLIAVGDVQSRWLIHKRLLANNPMLMLASAIHSNVTQVGASRIDSGSIIFPGVVIGPGAHLGLSCVINSNVSIGAGAQIGEFTTIGPNASIGSEAAIGRRTFVGMGAAISQGTEVGDECIVGALSFVRETVPNKHLAVGVPAMFKRSSFT